MGGSCPERADPAQTSEGADLREVGVLVLVAQPARKSAVLSEENRDSQAFSLSL